MKYEQQFDNVECTVVALLRNISVLEKVIDVLLNHWGEDKERARRGIQFICDHEVKKQGADADLQEAWRQWAKLHMAEEAESVEGPSFMGKGSWE